MELEDYIDKVIKGMAEDMLVVMQDILAANELGDSNLSKDLYTKTSEEDGNVMIDLFAHSYIYWVDIGRNPTPLPPKTRWEDPVSDIADWCRRKGIPADNNVVWAIITKIHKYGYDGKLFIDDFWEELDKTIFNDLDRLFDAFCDYLSNEVFND